MEDLAGKVAVVTGGASGIGRGMATAFADTGMKLVLADIEKPALDAAVAAFADGGAEVIGVRTDVASPESVAALADEAYAAFGAVHVVCNNAGVAGGGLSWEVPLSDWEWVLNVDLWGVIHGVRTFVPRMIEGGQPGHVVNTASMAGLTSAPFMGPYNVAKHGVVTLSETLHKDLQITGNTQIGVSVLCPGWVRTNITTSDRNRPEPPPPDLSASADAPAPVVAPDIMANALSNLIEGGMDPMDVGRLVRQTVLDGGFYILTHPWEAMIERRMRDVLDGGIPAVDFFPDVAT